MNAPSTHDGLTTEQIGLALNEIAEYAATISRLAILLTAETEDPRDSSAYSDAIEKMAGAVGLIADRTSEQLGTLVCCGTQPEDWLMPPAWHDAAEKAEEASHG